MWIARRPRVLSLRVSTALHVAALLAATLSTCCVVIAHERGWVKHVLLSALMTGAMIDAALRSILAPVYWAAIMLAASVMVAAAQGSRGTRRGRATVSDRLTPTLLALIAMAALILAMSACPVSTDPSAAVVSVNHGHIAQPGGSPLPLVAFAAGVGCAVVGAIHAFRSRGAAARLEDGAMAASMAMMAVAVMVG